MAKALRRCQATTLLAIQHADGEVLVWPPGSYVRGPDNRPMLLSNEQDLDELGRTKERAARAG